MTRVVGILSTGVDDLVLMDAVRVYNVSFPFCFPRGQDSSDHCFFVPKSDCSCKQ